MVLMDDEAVYDEAPNPQHCAWGCSCGRDLEAVDVARDNVDCRCNALDIVERENEVLRRDAKRFRQALVALVGSNDKDELITMVGAITMAFFTNQIGEEQFGDMNRGIQALIATSGVKDYED